MIQDEEGGSRKPPELTKKTAEDSYFRYLSQVAYMTSTAFGSMVDMMSVSSTTETEQVQQSPISQGPVVPAETFSPVVVQASPDSNKDSLTKSLVSAQPITDGGNDPSKLVGLSRKEDPPPPREMPDLVSKMPSLPDALGRGAGAERRRQSPETLPPQPSGRVEQDSFEFIDVAKPSDARESSTVVQSSTSRSVASQAQLQPVEIEGAAADSSPEEPKSQPVRQPHFWDMSPDMRVGPAEEFIQSGPGLEEQALQGVSESSMQNLTSTQARYLSQLNSLLFKLAENLREHEGRLRDIEVFMDRRYVRSGGQR